MWRLNELTRAGIAAATVARGVEEGTVERLSRGWYRTASEPVPAHVDTAVVAAKAPGSVLCLVSAAAYHQFGDDEPNEVWLAIPNGGRPPRVDWPAIRPVYWNAPEAFTIGVEESDVAGLTLRVTSPARTVVDMFRRLTTVTADAAIEVLIDYLRSGRPLDDVSSMAKTFAAGKLIEPYLRTLSHLEVAQ